MTKTLPLKPRMSEKAYAISQAVNTYTFDVPPAATKDMVKKAVESQYKAEVMSVNIANLAGKTKRAYRRRGQRSIGQRATISKAYVRLAKDHKLPIFEAVAEAEKKAAKAEGKVKK